MLLGLALSLTALGCSASDDAMAASGRFSDDCYYGCSDEAPERSDAGNAGMDAPAEGDEERVEPLHPLCGVGSCHPDRPTSCSSESVSSSLVSKSGEDDGGDGEEDEPAPPPRGDAEEGFGEGGGEEPGAGAGDEEITGPVAPPACRVKASPEGPIRGCEAAGSGQIDEPCVSASDCAPGLACVGPEHGGSCRPYCCGDPEACPSQSFCDVREIRGEESLEGETTRVPVCVPANGCKLLEHEPCASMGLVCGIVRSDGTTSCTSAGEGKLDEACPCAFGYVCAKSQNRCLKLCHVSLSAQECPGGTCQGGTDELPPGFGVCVGGYPDAG